MRTLNFRWKLVLLGTLLTITPLIFFSWYAGRQERQVRALSVQGCDRLALDDLAHVVSMLHANCDLGRELLGRQVAQALNTMRHINERAGGLRLDSQHGVPWRARNQLTGAETRALLPQMMLGGRWLGMAVEGNVAVPLVDEVTEVTGATSTVLQRMNAAGDMLRVATTVKDRAGKRALATYIPATLDNGAANPVIAAVLRGERYNGRAFVVDQWYVTAYEPIRDKSAGIIGMLYTGVPEALATAPLRSRMMQLSLNRTGYVYVLNARGEKRGHYIVSQGGRRDGENLWEARDAAGRLFIQDIVNRASRLAPGAIARADYPWRNPGDPEARPKIAIFTYFAPWDWVIAASVPMDEYRGTARELEALSAESRRAVLTAAAAMVAIAVVVWFAVATGLMRRTERIIGRLHRSAALLNDASRQVAESSRELAAAAGNQVEASGEIGSLLAGFAERAKENLAASHELDRLAERTDQAASQGVALTGEMNTAITGIQKTAAEVAGTNKLIHEIAFQTNLLALNAAVEAARAGQFGTGFAVVADAVRGLARRSSEAVAETAQKIERSIESTRTGAAIVARVAGQLTSIRADGAQLNGLTHRITAANDEHQSALDSIRQAAERIGDASRSGAAASEQCASSAANVSEQAEELETLSAELHGIFSR